MRVFTSPDDALVDILRAGGVVLLPTDTIYGLHALANDANAVARIAGMKGRDADKPFVVLGSSIPQLEELGVSFEGNEGLAEIWPAPLTAVLPLAKAVAASRGAATLAVRIPDLDWLRALVERTGPLVSTSANRSGEAHATTPNALARELHDSLDALLDAGVREGKPSTLVDFTGDEPRFIRGDERFFTQKLRKTLRKSL